MTSTHWLQHIIDITEIEQQEIKLSEAKKISVSRPVIKSRSLL